RPQPSLPPLSENLRDFTHVAPTHGLGSFGEGFSPALQSRRTRAVLLPESFRGGCSFGAGSNRPLPRMFLTNGRNLVGPGWKGKGRDLDPPHAVCARLVEVFILQLDAAFRTDMPSSLKRKDRQEFGVPV